MVVDGGGIGINPHSPPAIGDVSSTAEPKARQRKRAQNLSVSSHPRVPSYAIGREIEEKSGLEYLGYLRLYPTPTHDFIWRGQMETEKGNGRRDQKEPRQTMQKKDSAPNNQLKKNRKMEDKKKGSLHPRKLSPQKCLQRNKKQ